MTAPNADNRPTPGGAPVTAPEADALDAWLESVNATHRRGDHSRRHVERSRDQRPRGSRRSDRSPNGHIDPDTSLQATAQGFHAHLARAEREAQPDVPADAIWEKVMASTTMSTPAAHTSHAPARVAVPSLRGIISARASRTAVRPPARSIPAWLAGSHWAVSALMLAAVVIGIVALYGSFAGSPGPVDNPATNPNFAMGTLGETATSEPDIDRWLVDPSTVDCERDPAGWVDLSTWPTDRPKPVEHYLPFAPASPATGETLADRWRYLYTDCLPTAEDPLVTDDYGWMPTSPFGIPTDDQIAIAQEVSAALPMQDYRSYYIVRQPASVATPDTDGGPSGHLVLLPQDVVQLADGRVGGPLRLPIHTDDADKAISEFTGGLEAAATIFVVFEQVADQWLLDEQFSVCVGECEAVWADLATFENHPAPNDDVAATATPQAATPSAGMDWLAPIAPDECDVEESRLLEEVGALAQDPGQVVPREYIPTIGIEKPVTQEVASAQRAWESCRAQGLIGERRAVESLRYIAEVQPFDVLFPSSADTFAEWVSLNELMRAEFLDPDAESYLVESEALPPFDCETGYGETDLPAQVSYEVIQPQHLVQLPDGRIGGPVTSLVGPGFLQCLETRPPTLNSGYHATYIHIFTQDPTREGRWALDERFRICVSGCDTYYQEYAFLYPSSPAATPAATPSASTDGLQPIMVDVCDVEPLSDEEVAAVIARPGEEVERSYAPTGPVDPALAQEVAQADRAWQSCFVYGTAGERAALQSPRLTREGPGNGPGQEQDREDVLAELDRFDATRGLGEVMLTGDWRDYIIGSDLFDEGTPAPYQITDFIPTIPIPGQAVQLADGRVAIPIARLVPPDAYPLSIENAEDIPYWWIPVHILMQDSAQGDRWVVDEQLTICTGDCDQVRAEIVEYIAYLDSLATPDVATPVATPKARRDGQAG